MDQNDAPESEGADVRELDIWWENDAGEEGCGSASAIEAACSLRSSIAQVKRSSLSSTTTRCPSDSTMARGVPGKARPWRRSSSCPCLLASQRRKSESLEESLASCAGEAHDWKQFITLDCQPFHLLRLCSRLESLAADAFQCGCQRNVPGAMDVFEQALVELDSVSDMLQRQTSIAASEKVGNEMRSSPPPSLQRTSQALATGCMAGVSTVLAIMARFVTSCVEASAR
mmetsp:Transcript_110963/g.312847  ORF Transcript_110963/g.312847 Transcript_110963/m.312847 type:complete len:229 (+) Transcript_110963:165-851(+)